MSHCISQWKCPWIGGHTKLFSLEKPSLDTPFLDQFSMETVGFPHLCLVIVSLPQDNVLNSQSIKKIGDMLDEFLKLQVVFVQNIFPKKNTPLFLGSVPRHIFILGVPKFQPAGILKSTQSTRNPILVPKFHIPKDLVGKMIHSKSLNVGSVDYVGMVQYLRIFLGTNIHVFSCENPENMVLDPQIVIKRSIMVLGKRWQFHFGMSDFPGKSMVAPWSIHTHPAALEAPARIKPGAGALWSVVTNLLWKQHETAMVARGSLKTSETPYVFLRIKSVSVRKVKQLSTKQEDTKIEELRLSHQGF